METLEFPEVNIRITTTAVIPTISRSMRTWFVALKIKRKPDPTPPDTWIDGALGKILAVGNDIGKEEYSSEDCAVPHSKASKMIHAEVAPCLAFRGVFSKRVGKIAICT